MSEFERLSFGIFDFDFSTRELRREGVPVRLQAQPAQVLALLIRHAGETVARETLRRELWGDDTFVDFDRNINFCIAQIRTALGDSAESPRFIQTLPKRGYRFIAPGNASILRAPRQGRDLVAIGSALQAGYVVLGQVQRDGAGIRILAHLIRLPDQKHLWVVRADSPPEQALQGQSGLARRIATEFSSRLSSDRSYQSASRADSSTPITR